MDVLLELLVGHPEAVVFQHLPQLVLLDVTVSVVII